MADFSCSTCGKTFTQKGRYNAHMARKRPCKQNSAPLPLPVIQNIIAYEQSVPETEPPIVTPTKTTTAAAIIKPFLKWVGGKTQILDDVQALFPNTIAGNYHEPFLGGGSVLLGFLCRVKRGDIAFRGKVYASDANPNLIALYKNIQTQPQAVLNEVKRLTDTFVKCVGTTVNRAATTLDEAMTSQESYYYWIRAQYNALPSTERTSATASAMLLFLNKTCFRGVYREGPHGYNVPFGNYKNPSIVDEDHIRQVSELIRDVEFQTSDFRVSLARVVSGDFVYLDPPYAPETDKSFVSYTADGFGIEAHKELFKLCTALGTQFLMSNASVPLVKEAFPSPPFTTKVIPCRRAINSKTPDAMTNEVLITN